jgi:hypothetical protein
MAAVAGLLIVLGSAVEADAANAIAVYNDYGPKAQRNEYRITVQTGPNGMGGYDDVAGFVNLSLPWSGQVEIGMPGSGYYQHTYSRSMNGLPMGTLYGKFEKKNPTTMQWEYLDRLPLN